MTAPTRQHVSHPRLSYRDRGDITVISLHGELDSLSVPVLRAYLSDIRSRGRLHSIVDLTELAFIDCACLGVLVRHCKKVREWGGGSFALVGAQDTVGRILSATGLITWFETYDTVAPAIANAAGR
jgi:anti-sigma B factor antagonist